MGFGKKGEEEKKVATAGHPLTDTHQLTLFLNTTPLVRSALHRQHGFLGQLSMRFFAHLKRKWPDIMQ